MPLWLPPLAGGLIGAIIGSFLATVLIRWPAGRSALGGRSACDNCAEPLRAHELVPILSWAFQRGRCRRCHAAIDPTHPLVEAASGLIGATAFAIAPDERGAALALFGWLLLLAAMLDARHFWLPHLLSAIIAVAGLPLGGLAMQAAAVSAPLEWRVAAALVIFLLLVLIAAIFRRLRGVEGIGGGDPPFVAAVVLWTGPLVLPFLLLFASAAGIAIALVRRARQPDAEPRLPFGTLIVLAVPFALWAASMIFSST